MKTPTPHEEMVTVLTSGILDALGEIYSDSFAEAYGADIRRAVIKATADWRTDRKETPSTDDHPLSEVHYGHYIKVTLPWVPETEGERVERELWHEAYFWDPDDGPPPPRVGVNQLLRQDIWWRMNSPEGSPERTMAIKVEEMTHGHRLGLLGWLRSKARNLHSAVFAQLGDAPDHVWMSHERQDPSEWLEEEPLVRSLAHWTTPYGESPLTWRPMHEAPTDGTTILARWRYADPGVAGEHRVDELLAYWSTGHQSWSPLGGGILGGRALEWRELYDHEKPTACDCEDGEYTP